MTLPAARAEFLLPDGLVHMAPGGESPSLASTAAVLARYLECKGTGPGAEAARWEVYHRAKRLVAALFGLPGEESIAFVPSVSDGMNAVSHALPVRDGDNIVVEDVEFGAVFYPWLHLRERGVEIRIVRQRDWDPSEGHYAAAVDARTRAVAVSQVSYLTGLRHNVEALAAIAHARGAWLVLDATHAAGVVPVPGELCDFVLSACYKWVLGWHGVAMLGWNRARTGDVQPGLMGWRTPAAVPDHTKPLEYTTRPGASRFETGGPSYVGIFVLENALRYVLDAGIDRISDHDLRLAGELNRALRRLALDVATPPEPQHRAANTCFWHLEPAAVAQSLAEQGIWVSGGDGRVRIGTHLWCSDEDVSATVEALRRLTCGL